MVVFSRGAVVPVFDLQYPEVDGSNPISYVCPYTVHFVHICLSRSRCSNLGRNYSF